MTARRQAFCIFCNGAGLSREHVFPTWLHALLPRGEEFHNHRSTRFDNEVSQIRRTDSATSHRGPLRSRKIRKFCKACNNDWMSEIEQGINNLLPDMMMSKSRTILTEESGALASWAALKTVVAEFMNDPGLDAVQLEDRQWIWKHSTPPSEWRIWIGSTNAVQWHFRHFHAPIAFKSGIPGEERPTRPNAQSTTFGLGQLYIHVVSSSIPAALVRYERAVDRQWASPENPVLIKLWPEPRAIQWPGSRFIDSACGEEIAHAIATHGGDHGEGDL